MELRDIFGREIIKRSVYALNVELFYKYYKDLYAGKYICVAIKILNEDCFSAC
jgi:hypothetical protein